MYETKFFRILQNVLIKTLVFLKCSHWVWLSGNKCDSETRNYRHHVFCHKHFLFYIVRLTLAYSTIGSTSTTTTTVYNICLTNLYSIHTIRCWMKRAFWKKRKLQKLYNKLYRIKFNIKYQTITKTRKRICINLQLFFSSLNMLR